MSGLTIADFWNMTLKEINFYIKVMGDKRKRDAEEQKIDLYNQASLIASFVSLALSGKKLPSFSEVFPNTEVGAVDAAKYEEQRKAIQKDAWLAWADVQNQFWNKRHSKGSEISNGDTATSS